MIFGLLLLFAPILLFLISIPFSKRLRPVLRKFYILGCGFLIFSGTGFSLYLAFYAGEQGGIGAFFVQMTVIVLYLIIVIVVLITAILSNRND